MAKQKFHPARLGAFSGAKAYIGYVEVLKKRHNAVGWTFCDAINLRCLFLPDQRSSDLISVLFKVRFFSNAMG
jgi:hypothetical protein